ncbi:hypothetical protein [Calothrix sp. UHCC 0171]|uniref:hypothetical protein n=1 Tax=Calothrix sp. UHCC 0171 TaxID=3110245 RepID=UPI002B20508D|nr:hypothetical protein [Calothrix sp. UHCC 0171]MEA5570031.1 hypothetical protein [Calothrix sp. UHCC 0171]
MSQDNPNSQPPSSPEPRRNRRQPRRRQEDAMQTSQTRYQSSLPFWKAKIIEFLRGTIGILEATVDKLETEPQDAEVRQQGWWGAILISIRAVLPIQISSQISDTVLSGTIIVIAIVTVWTTSSFFVSKNTEVAINIPSQEAPPLVVATPSKPDVLPTPSVEEQVKEEIEQEKEKEKEEEEIKPPIAEETEEKPPTEEIPPEKTQTVVEQVKPEPTPEFVPLTPEQTLIAAIENRVAEVSKGVTSGLVKSIQANFRNSSLIVTINDDWYSLKKSQQDKLAADIFQRSQELDFSHLEILDSQERLVARNPVVGDEMIIFQRQSITENQG